MNTINSTRAILLKVLTNLSLTSASLLSSLALSQGLVSSSISVIPNSIVISSGLNGSLTPNANELVTMGLPFASCTLTDIDDFKLFDETGLEVAIFAKETLSWPIKSPCSTASIRSLKVQFNFDATNGSKLYSWNLDGRTTTNDISERTVTEIADDRVSKAGVNEPRVYAILPPTYLVQTGIIPPTSIASAADYDAHYFPEKWEYDARDFDFSNSAVANWLFDRTSTSYIQALRQGSVEYYRDAYTHHEFWISKMEVTGRNTSQDDYCIGGFDMGGKSDTFGSGGSGCDTKYIYLQPFKLHLALTGDDSWVPSENGTPSPQGVIDTREEMVDAVATILYTGAYRSSTSKNIPGIPSNGFRTPYSSLDDAYSERQPGFGLQTILNACELSLDPAICSNVDTIIDNTHAMAVRNLDGTGVNGYLSHSWRKHEGTGLPWLGTLSQNYTNATSIILDNVLGSGKDTILAGHTIRVGAFGTQQPTLINDIVDNGDGTWTLNLDAPITDVQGKEVVSLNNPATGIEFNVSTDRIFSPWMQSIMADGVWQYYNWTEDPVRKQKAKDLLLGFGRAYTAYAPDGTRGNPATYDLIESAFGVKVFNSGVTAKAGCGLTTAPYTRYVANPLLQQANSNKPYSDYMFSSGGFSDLHIPEGLFQVSLGILFETDPAKKTAMIALAEDMLNWFERYSCTSGNRNKTSPVNDPPRAYGWQNKADPFGTFQFVSNFSVALNYNTETFVEASADDGSSSTILGLSLSGGESFSVSNGLMQESIHYTIDNLPTGLTAIVTGTSASTATISLSGNATTHESSDNISNIEIVFLDNAFVKFPASAIANSSKLDISLNFIAASYNNLSILTGDTFLDYSGLITNLTNRGEVIGPILSGIVDNVNGVLTDVTLTTDVNGGLLQGYLRGAGVISNAILDLDSADSAITIGTNTQITANTAGNILGLDLTQSIKTGQVVDFFFPLLIDAQSLGINLKELITNGVNSFFGNTSTIVNVNNTIGTVEISNSEAEGLLVSGTLLSVVTSNLQDGVNINTNGELEIISDGIASTFLPGAADIDAFLNGIVQQGGSVSPSSSPSSPSPFSNPDDGSITFDIHGVTFTGRFGYSIDVGAQNLESVVNDDTAVIEITEDSLYKNLVKLVVRYPNNSSQDITPFLHDSLEFSDWVRAAGYTSQVDSETGEISIIGTGDTIIWRAIPGYILSEPWQTLEIGIKAAGDRNGDGIEDYYFTTSKGSQLMYGL